MAKLKPLVGRMKGNFREEAMKALGANASAEAIATKANALAKHNGYEEGFTPEWVEAKMKEPSDSPTKRKGKQADGGYTIAQVLSLAKDVSELSEKAGGKAGLEAILDAVDKAGGTAAVKEILEGM